MPGCQIFNKGEELCPLKDDRAMLEEKMDNADGAIFTSPNYVFNVSGLMKNFINSRRKSSIFGHKKSMIFKDLVMSAIDPAFLKCNDLNHLRFGGGSELMKNHSNLHYKHGDSMWLAVLI